MEKIFLEDTGYKGFFIVGFRKDPTSPFTTQRTGTVILKRTFDIDTSAGILIPKAEALPIFIKDQPDNFVNNSNFNPLEDSDTPPCWQPDQLVTIAAEEDPNTSDSDSENYFLKVTGAANGRVVQTLKFKESLGGRHFWLSFYAKSADNTTARIENVQLESNSHIICAHSADLTKTMSLFYVHGTWPSYLKTKEMKVVLRMATNSSRTVFYENVQVEERDHLTVWDSSATLRFEKDIVAYKPEGDLIVLGFTDVTGLCRVNVDGVTWLQRHISINDGAREKAMFGWEPRQTRTSGYSTDPDDYPLEWPFTDPARDPLGAGYPQIASDLPPFDNIFNNGYRRTNLDEGITAYPPFPYLPASAQILIERDKGSDYGFTLPGETISANCYYYKGTGPDKESNWQRRPIIMNLDTLVIEPEKNSCYILWRGVWPFDEINEGDYRRLEVKSVF